MSARRAFLSLFRRKRSRRATDDPPAFWGRIGAYEAVTRHGMLFMLAPQPAHPSLRVKNDV